MHDGRAAAAQLAVELDFGYDVSYRFCNTQHMNFLEMESLIRLLRRVTREGMRAQRLVVLVESRVLFGSRLLRRSSAPKLTLLQRKLFLWCFAYNIAL